jgi:hypothetical protein
MNNNNTIRAIIIAIGTTPKELEHTRKKLGPKIGTWFFYARQRLR